MDRKDFLQLIITDTCFSFYKLPWFICSGIQSVSCFVPFFTDNFIFCFFHCLTHQTESHVLREFNITDWLNKSPHNFLPVFVRIWKNMCYIMCNNNHVEWIVSTHIYNLLEASQCTHIISEVLCKLIPNKSDGF